MGQYNQQYAHIPNHTIYQQYNDNGIVPIVGVDENLVINYANQPALAFFGFSSSEFLGVAFTEFCNPSDDTEHVIASLKETHAFNNLACSVVCKKGAQKRVLISSKTFIDESEIVCTYLFLTDVTVYKKNEDLLAYLNKAAEELAQARDSGSALQKISKLIVPKFANWFTIDTLVNDQLNMLILAHEDPEIISWAYNYREKYPPDLNSDEGTALVLKTGKPSFVPVITDEMLAAGIQDPEKLTAIRNLNLRSIITVAMFNKDVITGIITFISTEDGKFYDEQDLKFAQNLANHIGLALENTRLNEEAAAEIRQRKSIEQELKKSEELFRLMAETMPQKVFSTDADSRLLYLNPQWEQYTGHSLKEIDKVSLSHFIHPDDLEKNLKMWEKALITGEPFLFEHRFLDKEGNYIWHLTRALPLKDHQDNIIRWIGTITDINDQKLKEEKKDEFISIASHELRTPLTTIKAFFQLAKRSMNPEEKTYVFIDKAGKQLERLEKLITDLLDVSKINSGKLMYNKEEFDFGKVLRDTVENVQHTTSTHTIIIEQSVDIPYKGDKLRIEEVITNFLTNAIKYSPDADKVIIRSEFKDNNIQVSVQDFGIGIASKNLNGLFERFHRVDSTSMRFQGLGLGLFISAEIIKGHNGKYWIESEIGKGSIFHFLLPVY